MAEGSGERRAKGRRDEPAFQRALRESPARLLDIAFEAIDRNGRGSFTRNELVSSPFGSGLTRLWKDINTDGDENIDRQEWRAFFDLMHQRAVIKMGEEKGAMAYHDFVAELVCEAGIDLTEPPVSSTDLERETEKVTENEVELEAEPEPTK